MTRNRSSKQIEEYAMFRAALVSAIKTSASVEMAQGPTWSIGRAIGRFIGDADAQALVVHCQGVPDEVMEQVAEIAEEIAILFRRPLLAGVRAHEGPDGVVVIGSGLDLVLTRKSREELAQ